MNSKFFILLLTVSMLIYLSDPPVSNAQSLSLSIMPSLTEIMVKPGKNFTRSFKLTNLSDDTIINYQIVPFNDKGLIYDSLKDTVSWLEIINPEPGFILKKGESREIILKLSPPPDTKENDYYQAILFRTSLPPTARGSQSGIQQTISSLLFINVSNRGLEKKAEITGFTIPFIMDSFDRLTINASVKNTGKTYFRTNGNLVMKGILGEIKFPLVSRINLLGQERRLLLSGIKDNSINGFFIGKYNLKLNLTLDQGNINLKQEKTVYALPYKAVLIFSAVYVFIVFRKKRWLQK